MPTKKLPTPEFLHNLMGEQEHHFRFGDIVVVDRDEIGVVVKCWQNQTYEVYVRCRNGVSDFKKYEIEHYIYGKILTKQNKKFYE